MMIVVNHAGDSITGSMNGKPFSVSFDEARWKTMKELEQQANTAETMADIQVILNHFEPLTKESYKDIVETACPYLYVNKHTNKYYLKWGDHASTHAIPQAFVDKILLSVEKGLDVKPLVKCIVRFFRNENFTETKLERFAAYVCAPYVNMSRVSELTKDGFPHAEAVKKATGSQVAITMEGLLVGYKVSKEVLTRYTLNEEEEVVQKSRYTKSVDEETGLVSYNSPEFVEEKLFEPAVVGQGYDAFMCDYLDKNGNRQSKEGHHIRVGGTHYLKSWKQVDTNDLVSCRPGLHVGGLSYINHYQADGTVTHNVLIDPADIGAICDINPSSDGALRVRRYFVHSSFGGVNRTLYHSSKFAAINDTEYRAMLQAAVEVSKQKIEEANKELAFKKSIGEDSTNNGSSDAAKVFVSK